MRERLSVNKSDETSGDDIIPLRRTGRKSWFSKGRVIGLAVLALMVGLGFFLAKTFNKHLPWEQANVAPGGKGAGSLMDGSITSISGLRGGTAPVVTAKAEIKDLPFAIHNIGNVEAFSVVNIIAQVGGQLTKVAFTQGQDVRQGDLLFKIDPRPYEAQLAQAEANSDRDKSQIKAAIANLQRDLAVERQNEAGLKRDTATQQ